MSELQENKDDLVLRKPLAVRLPIEPIVGTRPQLFRWRQKIDSRLIECEGVLPASLEGAVTELVAQARYLTATLADSRKDNEALQALLVTAQEKVTELEGQQLPPVIPTTVTRKDKK